MEKSKSRQKRKKDYGRSYYLDRQIPDAPTMKEFECLLGESPTNYPRVEGIENMESELHSAAIDTEVPEEEQLPSTSEEIPPIDPEKLPEEHDEVDTAESPLAPESAPDKIEEIQDLVSSVKLSDSPTAPVPVENLTKVKRIPKPTISTESIPKSPEKIHPPSLTSEIAKTLTQTVVPFTDTQLASLYTNQELSFVDAFITEFIETQLRSNAMRQQHRLHDLLMSYLRVRNHLILNSHELEGLKKNCKEVQKQLWHLDKASITESGECQDGNPVSATHEYSIAHFNQQALTSLTKNLSSIKELLHNAQALYCYEAEVLKLQIEHYVQRVCISCKELATLPQNAPVNLTAIQMPSPTMPELMELRMCITILFNFQRRVLKDGKFVLDSREWLSKLIAVLLRVATWQDHLFILSHILRCPGGVTNWAAGFVQAPAAPKNRGISASPLNDPYLDHMVATLAVMLLPVKEREKFLEQVQISLQDTGTNPGDTVWVMLDEEGEEDEDLANLGANLLESDLITLLNQIPMDKLFEQVLLIERTDDSARQDTRGMTEHHMLKLFAFSTVIVRLFKQGLRTYDSPRYRQLAKRLSALIRDVVQYASDQWEAFDKSVITDPLIITRLQTEYDCFFLRATMCIFSSRRLGAWQYLAAIPYHNVSISTLWYIFYALHKDTVSMDPVTGTTSSEFESELNSSTIRKQFEEKLSDMPGDESYFLLTTFANMAMARSKKDYDFIRATTIDLFQIGFLSEKTQESCSKDARSLLSNLTSKHPSLLSNILLKLKDNFGSVGKLSLYLFTELSIGKWIPQDEDIAILSSWLHNFALSSTESHLARLILTNLNWGLDRNGDLYLPLHLHYKIALLVVKLTIKFVPDSLTQSESLFVEGVKQVSSMIRPQNNEQAFTIWAWEMISRLRLHQLDQSNSSSRNAMTNPAEAFRHIPNMESDAALEDIVKGVTEQQPIACYVAVLMTLEGHSVPLIYSQGFSRLALLESHYKYEHIIMALQHIIPLFLDCSELLNENVAFKNLIKSLINADRTYVKIVKNLIAPEFPGLIIKHFGNMVETHLVNYNRYCLQSPEPFVRLWLQVLIMIPDWNRDHNVMYLLDIVLRAAFFHQDASLTSDYMIGSLYANLGTGKTSGSIGSFLSWATGSGNCPSLLGGPVQSIWLAHRVLTIEQQMRELKSGLWYEFRKELAQQSKTSLDAALKHACASLRLPAFSANGLAIYRWSQQALDTPLNHPLLPLLWQNFFVLFLARVPTPPGLPDRGGLGDKFFEGMMNLSYLKKIKKRLHDTTEYFQSRAENDFDDGKPITDDRRVFYLHTAKYYKTLSLWLEEPRLQEAGLYLPALPPQYMSQKLIPIIQEDSTAWLEYVDYFQVQQIRLKATVEWERTCLRDVEDTQKQIVQTPTTPLEPADPMMRIFRRLGTYESPTLPPPLSRHTALVDHISKDSLYDSERLIKSIKPHLKIIIDYAQTYNLMVSEHAAVDCNFLELIPTLYKETETRVDLHALCDLAPAGQRRLRSGTPPTAHCAGPAVITIKISEAVVSEAVNQMISQNRAEYENLLVKASQPPPSKVTQACVFSDHMISLLEHELNVNRTCENTAILRKVQESGVSLFYNLVEFYSEEAAQCPPTKQLITTCIEKLGQLFISGEECEGPRLLNTIMERPGLGGLLGPHFTPVAGGAAKFLQMYQTVCDLSTGTNADLCFVLLSKFDVGSWLNYRRPRLCERSMFIDLVTKALCNIGLNPDDEKLILHELFRNHLRLVLLHEFPEHYGEVLSAILRGSEGQNLSLDVWRDLLGALSGRPKTAAPIQPNKVRDEIRRYATEQRMLSRQEIHDTAVLLSKHFMKERLQYGLYGLYPKYRVYNEPLIMFLGMIGHGLVVLTLQFDRGSLADQLCERIWPVLSEMFAPWITPYWTRNLREPTAAWIQQLTDDRSVLLPWIITDGPYANRTVAMFVECVRFIIDTMPASSKILCYLWQFYVNNFAHASVKDHILNVIHGNFLSLPWDRFSPGINDVELMVKVVDQYLPDSHLFLGSVFTSINWGVWINEVLAAQPLPVAARMHICLLNLFVKLSNEPNVRQNERSVQLIADAEKFSWHLVDATAYDQVINWHVMSCDPRVILSYSGDEAHQIDVAINNLLKVVAAYDPSVTHFHPTTLKKRQMYVRSSVKLLVNCTTRHKSLVTNNIKAFTAALSRMLDEMEIVVTSTVSEQQQSAEAGLLVTELLNSINQSGLLVEQLRSSWTNWLSNKTANSPILLGILRVIGVAVASPTTLGELMEASLEAYFKHSVTDDIQPSWGMVLSIIPQVVPRQPPVEGVLVAEGRLLALYTVLMKRLPACGDIKTEGMMLISLIDWIAAIKPMENIEAKLPLLWAQAFALSYRQCKYCENTVIAARSLKKLARALLTMADDVGQGWGILGAIGIRKGSQLSIRCKFLARALGVYCLAQLPDSKSEQQIVRYTPHSPGIAPLRANEIDTLEIRPNADAIKGIQSLDGLINNKQYGELKGDIETAVRLIRDSANSLHNAVNIIGLLTSELYNERFLHVLTD